MVGLPQIGVNHSRQPAIDTFNHTYILIYIVPHTGSKFLRK